MARFMYLTCGFERPTPEIMKAWGAWFETIKDNLVEMGHFPRGREISKAGAKELPLGAGSITGYVIVNAPDFEAAAKLAETNPYIDSIRIYEIKAG